VCHFRVGALSASGSQPAAGFTWPLLHPHVGLGEGHGHQGGLAHTLLLLQGIFNGEKVPSLAQRGTHQRVQILQTLAFAVGEPFTRESY
jgi:hypothetical protein